MIYFITDGEYTKIGYTAENKCAMYFNRLEQLQTANARILKVVGLVLDAKVELEKKLHKRLEEYRVNREWFDLRDFDLNLALTKMKEKGFKAYTKEDLVLEDNKNTTELYNVLIKKREEEKILERKRENDRISYEIKTKSNNKFDWIANMNKFQ